MASPTARGGDPLLATLSAELLSRERVMVTDWAAWRDQVRPTLSWAVEGLNRVTELEGQRRRWIDADLWPFAMRELAGPYLRWLARECGGRTSRLGAGGNLSLLDIPAPLHFAGGLHVGEWAYVDLVRAFWTIYRTMTYDCMVRVRDDGSVIVGHGGMDLSIRSDLLAGDAIARNAVIGIARIRRGRMIRGGRRVVVDGPGRWTSPGLWAVIASRLHYIARAAVDQFGAIYVATDGYIVPRDRAAALIAWIEGEGLSARVKVAGDGTVTGVGSWAIGDRRSGHFRPRGSPPVRSEFV